MKVFFPFIFFLSCYLNLAAQLSGTYTIDPNGSGPKNINNIGLAVTALRTQGVSGPVVFKIADGTYTGYFTIPSIAGASATNTISFVSASGDSSKVILQYQTSSSGFVVQLDGADYITFDGLTIATTSTTAGKSRVVQIQGGAHNNTFTHCVLKGLKEINCRDVYGCELGSAVVCSPKDKDTGNRFINNHFLYGTNALYLLGTLSGREKGLVLRDNMIDSSAFSQVYLEHQLGTVIEGNLFRGSSAWSIRISDCNEKVIIAYNRIMLKGYALTGILIQKCTASSTDHGIIANNFIRVDEATHPGATGIAIVDLQYFDIVHNTIKVSNVKTAYGIGIGASKNSAPGHNRILNNIISVRGVQAYAIFNDAQAESIDTSDHNVFYSPPDTGAIFLYKGISYKSFSDYQKGARQDPSSSWGEVEFTGDDDLHVPILDSLFYGKAYPGMADDDIDHDKRKSTPDIGADEWVFHPDNVRLLSLITEGKGLCGKQPIIVRMQNVGSTDIDSVRLTYTVNDSIAIAKKLVFNPALKFAEDTVLALDSILAGDKVASIRIFTSYPNGRVDSIAANDTVKAHFQSALSGNYSIGIGKNYPTFKSAAFDLKTRGICGPVVFNVADGTYQEHVILEEITGSSETNTITFQSASGDSSRVILTSPAYTTPTDTDYTLALKGTDYCTVRNMTIQRTDSGTYAAVVNIWGEASHNTFTHCQILGVDTVTGYGLSNAYGFYSYTGDTYAVYNDNYNTYSHNLIRGGVGGFRLWGEAYVGVPPYENYEVGTVIEDNYIDSFEGVGISVVGQDNLVIRRNTVISNARDGIVISWATNGFLLEGNKIMLKAPSRPKDWINVALNIHNVKCDSNHRGITANNFFSVEGGFNIYISEASYLNIYHNNLYNSGVASSSLTLPGAIGFVFYANSDSGRINIKNNVIKKLGSGVVMHFNAPSNNDHILSCDYNDIYTTSSTFANWSKTSLSTFSAWRTTTGFDKNSITVDPQYSSNTDLHVAATELYGAGVDLKIKTDIDGDLRSSPPDIGADEFVPRTKDLSIKAILSPRDHTCGLRTAQLGVVVFNQGNEDQANFALTLEVSGKADTTFTKTYTKTLKRLSADTFYFTDSFTTLAQGTYNLKAYPALKGEQFFMNDTAVKVIESLGLIALQISGDTTPCAGSTEIYSVERYSRAHYKWTISGGTIKTKLDSNKVVVQWADSATDGALSAWMVTFDKCEGVDSGSVAVQPVPVVAITGPDSSCENGVETYTVSNHKGSTYTWSAKGGSVVNGQGTNAVQINWVSAGSDSVLVQEIDSNGCAGTAYSFTKVHTRPAAGFTLPSKICEGEIVKIKNLSSAGGEKIKSFFWDFGDGTTSTDSVPLKSYTKAGTYFVRLYITNISGCVDSFSQDKVTVYPRPVTAFYTVNNCLSGGVYFIDSTSKNDNLAYYWDFGDGAYSTDPSPYHTYAQPGEYPVKLRTNYPSTGCGDSLEKKIRVYDKPEAAFYSALSCAGDSSFFHADSSTVADAILEKYIWDFGDNSAVDTSTGPSISHVYAKPGTYSVKLVARSIHGCDDTLIKPVAIYKAPVAGFLPSAICSTLSLSFKNLFPDSLNKYTWDFGDGDTSLDENPVHTYDSAATYKITLHVSNPGGCSDQYSQYVKMHPILAAEFTAADACEGDTVQFLNNSSGNANSWSWTFGHLGTSGEINPGFHFSTAGSYSVKLVVSDGVCTSSVTKTIMVSPKPKPRFSASVVCQGSATVFTDSSEVVGGAITKRLWIFGQSQSDTSTKKDPAFIFPSAGTYPVQLVVESTAGCTTATTQKVLVLSKPDIDFASQANGPDVAFTVTDSTYSGYFWDFGDGITSDKPNPVHSYPDLEKTYTVILDVANEDSCHQIITKQLDIEPLGISPAVDGQMYSIRIAPNPFTTSTSLTYQLAQRMSVKIDVCDLLGREIIQLKEMREEAGDYTVSIKDFEELSKPGVYVLRLRLDNRVFSYRLIKL